MGTTTIEYRFNVFIEETYPLMSDQMKQVMLIAFRSGWHNGRNAMKLKLEQHYEKIAPTTKKDGRRK